ncbi:MAG: ferritin-like domain-containing protein [Pseudomonadales bacterium]|nr:ferritin-like domain-containing protein [Pseudomonadales bacterium]
MNSVQPKKGTDCYETLMQVVWSNDYESPIAKLDDLYHNAKENQWNASDLDWDTPIDPSNPTISKDHHTYCRMPFYRKLSKPQQEDFLAHSTTHILSQFLHCEQGALLTAAALAHSAPDSKAKLNAATQIVDEARHVEAYKKYVDKIAPPYPLAPWMKRLIDSTLQSNNFCKVMIGMNIIVEGLALNAFNRMYQQTEEPLLKSLTFNIIRDEARHVSFGQIYLAPTIANIHEDEREDLAQFTFDIINILLQGQKNVMDSGFLKVLEMSNIDVKDFTAGLKEAEQLGISRQLPPGQIHSVKDLMMPALIRIGLVTPRTKELFEKAGIPVTADLDVLAAMRPATPNLICQ